MHTETLFLILSIVLVAGGIQGIFMACVILIRGTETSRWMGVHILSISVFIIFPEVYKYFALDWPHITASYFPVILVIGPSMYLYVRSFLLPDSRQKSLWHFLPTLVNYIYLLPFFSKSSEEKISLIHTVATDGIPYDFKVMWAFYCVHLVIYLYLTHSFLQKVLRVRDFNHQEWLLTLMKSNHITWGLYVLFFIAYQLGLSQTHYYYFTYIFGFGLSLIVYTMGYLFIRKNQILNPVAAPKYRKSGLTAIKARQLAEELGGTMKRDRLFVDPDLSLSQLSKLLNISSHQASQIINEFYHMNFYEFINSYRIQEASKILASRPAGTRILEVAFEVGFKSKSTFNAAFKKIMNMTPTAYQKQHAPDD